MVPCAYLRAFEPLDAFPAAERERWGSYVSAGDGVSTREAVDAEAAHAAARLLGGRGVLRSDAALVRRVGSRIHLCPLQLQLRSAAALHRFLQAMPEEVVDAFVPSLDEQEALELLGRSGRAPHIIEAAWAVPLAWFVLFDPEERHFVAPPEGRTPRLTYLTTARQATERVERAADIIETGLEDGEDILADLADIGTWVDAFDPGTVVELDYGPLAGQFGRAELEQDRSCHEVWSALQGLADGDVMAAAAYYGVVRSRWSSQRHKERAS